MTAVALSLTGSGHLLVYQLGACSVLQQSSNIFIKHVSGSSGGAIVASLMAFSCCLDDYARDFIKNEGKGVSLLRERLVVTPSSLNATSKKEYSSPSLSICTTACRNGELRVFEFRGSNNRDDDLDLVMRAVDASCRIPISFHPWDIISPFQLSYSDTEGIQIDDHFYVDGGIAAPAPPIPQTEVDDSSAAAPTRIIISPIAGNCPASSHRISPSSSSSFYRPTIYLNHDFGVHLSFGNMIAMRIAAGMTTSSELDQWYLKGKDDAQVYLENLSVG